MEENIKEHILTTRSNPDQQGGIIIWFEDVHKLRIQTSTTNHGTVKMTIYKWNFDNNVGKWERHGFIKSHSSIQEANKNGIEEAIKLLSVK